MSEYLLISDAAKEVQVESHVLRYWEEELKLPIKRNELGHRYYTMEDVEQFKQIKEMKESGLQLKAIKMILKDGKLNVLSGKEQEEDMNMEREEARTMPINIIGQRELPKGSGPLGQRELPKGSGPLGQRELPKASEPFGQRELPRTAEAAVYADKEEKAKRLQWLLQQMIRDTIQENNEILLKELDYQFRSQEEREDERMKLQEQRDEKYYAKMDELLRKKSRRTWGIKKDKKRKQTP